MPEAATAQDAEARHEEGALLGSVIGPFPPCWTFSVPAAWARSIAPSGWTPSSRSEWRSRCSRGRSATCRGAAVPFRAPDSASLAHPHIVTLLDGGVRPPDGPYLVMEYVDGVPITRYCADARLRLSERLQLFRQVCSAVHYAHRHAVVHRDLKPANILVTAEGVPKVLDFGVAKLLDDQAPVAGGSTTVRGPGPLTPNYASPEQLAACPLPPPPMSMRWACCSTSCSPASVPTRPRASRSTK